MSYVEKGNMLFPDYPVEFTLTEDLHLQQWVIPVGTVVKLWSTQFHKWILLSDESAKLFTNGQRLFAL